MLHPLRLLLPLLFLCFLPFALCSAREKGAILIICSYNPAAHQTSLTISDYMEEYDRLGGGRDIIIENMNCKSFSESPLWGEMMRQILSKYQGENLPGQIILLGQEAWAAYLSQRDSLEVKVPVMCSLVSSNYVVLPKDTVPNLYRWRTESMDLFADKIEIPELKSGFINQYDIESNIRMICSFYPRTKHIAFISDNTYGGVAMQALVRKEMRKFSDLELILLDGRQHTIYSLVSKLRRLPEHTVILVGTWRVDRSEGYFMRNATYAMMEAVPYIPVFTPSSVSMGYWAIGGVMPEYRQVGKEMALESIRIDTQAELADIRLSIIGSRPMLDSKKLKEWQLDATSLPYAVQLVNEPPTFYRQYKYHIWMASLLFVLLATGMLTLYIYYLRTKRLKNKLQKSEQALRAAKEKAEESNHLKSTFLANVSHEIQTPLNSIVGFSDILAIGDNTKEEEQSYYRIIRSNSELLLRLINDILDFSRLEANRVILTLEECDVIELCRKVMDSISKASHTDNEFIFTSSVDAYRLTTDVQRLQQVLINLLVNADKFTERGKIVLHCSISERSKQAFISVTDTGCGIPENMRMHIFERFEKLNEYEKGTGLGLAICKLTVQKWKGEIWVDPNYTGGARFVFSHPLDIKKL